MRDYDEAESTREIWPIVYVGRDSMFLKDRVYSINVSWGSESSNATILSRGTNGASLEF